MATIDAGNMHDKRELNRELPLIPFIDFLLCLVTFLLITAVWSSMARISASALLPGDPALPPPPPTKRLHVEVRDTHFVLRWRDGATLVSATDLPRRAVALPGGDTAYPELARRVEEEWRANSVHRDPADAHFDELVLHTGNTLPYSELIAVIDAVKATKRAVSLGGRTQEMPAFRVSFATD